MKRSAIIFVVLIGLTMSGCLVSSLHPFYKMKDKIFDEAMVGNWMDTDSSLWIIRPNESSETFLGPERNDTTYKIIYYEKKDAATYLQGTLFVLNGIKYVDFFPNSDYEQTTTDMISYHMVPVHTLARIQFKQDTMMLFWFGEEWLNDLLDNNKIRIAHEKISQSQGYPSNLLTAETNELQKFIKKYMNSKKTNAYIDEAFQTGKETDEHIFLKLFPYNGPIPEDD